MIAEVPGGLAVAIVWAIVELTRAVVKARANRATLSHDERRLLSVDEREFRRVILEELAAVRGELAKCQQQHAEAVVERDRMREQLEQLKEGTA